MISTAALVAGVLNFSEPEFFSPDPSVIAARESQLLDSDFLGVAVNAPAEIDTRRRDKLPLFMAARFSGDRDWDIPLNENCVLVGSNLSDGSVHFAPALVSRKDKTRAGKLHVPRGPKPEGLPSVAAQITELDPKDKLPIGWNTGTWALGVISYDWPSNTVVVKLKGDDPPPPTLVRGINPPPNLRREDSALPSYFAMDKTPRLPDSGVSFTAECVAVEGKQQLKVFGALTLPMQDFMLPRQEVVHEYDGGRREKVAAVVPVTFAVLALNWELPLQFDWTVPVYGDKLNPGMPARACFAIDALATANAPSLGPGDYLCYVFASGQIFGPQSLKISERK